MSKSPIVDQIRAVLFSEHKWTQGSNARDAEGKPIASFRPEAVCFCLIGAAGLVTHSLPIGPQRTKPDVILQQAIYSCTKFHTVAQFNDSPNTTFKDIHWLLDKAAEIEEQAHQ